MIHKCGAGRSSPPARGARGKALLPRSRRPSAHAPTSRLSLQPPDRNRCQECQRRHVIHRLEAILTAVDLSHSQRGAQSARTLWAVKPEETEPARSECPALTSRRRARRWLPGAQLIRRVLPRMPMPIRQTPATLRKAPPMPPHRSRAVLVRRHAANQSAWSRQQNLNPRITQGEICVAEQPDPLIPVQLNGDSAAAAPSIDRRREAERQPARDWLAARVGRPNKYPTAAETAANHHSRLLQ